MGVCLGSVEALGLVVIMRAALLYQSFADVQSKGSQTQEDWVNEVFLVRKSRTRWLLSSAPARLK